MANTCKLTLLEASRAQRMGLPVVTLVGSRLNFAVGWQAIWLARTFINHSCEPNCHPVRGTGHAVTFTACRDVSPRAPWDQKALLSAFFLTNVAPLGGGWVLWAGKGWPGVCQVLVCVVQ